MATIDVNTINDNIYEADETFYVIVSNVSNATLLDGTGVGVINDDETTPTLAVNDISIGEGSSGNFTIALSGPTTGNVTVQYVLAASSATSGIDYTYT